MSFAFSYPYSYEKNVKFVDKVYEDYKDNEEIYVTKEVITYSSAKRDIHLLTISSHECKTRTKEEYFSDLLFPER